MMLALLSSLLLGQTAVCKEGAECKVSRLISKGIVQSKGVATASLPTCNAARAGSLEYDTTTTTFKYCNGTAWTALAGTTSAGSYSGAIIYTAYSPSASIAFGSPFYDVITRATVPTSSTTMTISLSFVPLVAALDATKEAVLTLREDGVTIASITMPCTSAIGTRVESHPVTVMESDLNGTLTLSWTDQSARGMNCTGDALPIGTATIQLLY